MEKKEPQNQCALSNKQQGPLLRRVSLPHAFDLQRRLTGEMCRFQSDTDYRPMPDTGATEASPLGPHSGPETSMSVQNADFVPTFQKNVVVTGQCEPAVTLAATDCDDEFLTLEAHKGKDVVGPVATANILPNNTVDDVDSHSDNAQVFNVL